MIDLILLQECHFKFRALLDDLLKMNFLGIAIGHVCVIEFQKRGLPLAHIVLILEDNPSTLDGINKIV
jgi:hypothetical protein